MGVAREKSIADTNVCKTDELRKTERGSASRWMRGRGDAFEHRGNHIPKGLIREAPEGCSLHRHRSSAKR